MNRMCTCSNDWRLWRGGKADSRLTAPADLSRKQSGLAAARIPRACARGKQRGSERPLAQCAPPVACPSKFPAPPSGPLSPRPYELVGRKQTPCLVAIDDAARDKLARHRRIVEAVASEAACQPQTAFDFANLRHTMNRAPQGAAPDVRDTHFA